MSKPRASSRASNIALGYVRVREQSGSAQVERDRQVASIEIVCQWQGWKPEIYEDTDPIHSAMNLNRLGWNALQARLADSDVVALVVDDPTRITRNESAWSQLIDELQARGILLHLVALQQAIQL
jgi:DNA invertase Pin-like site-specific DNA recombinase